MKICKESKIPEICHKCMIPSMFAIVIFVLMFATPIIKYSSNLFCFCFGMVMGGFIVWLLNGKGGNNGRCKGTSKLGMDREDT